MQYHNVRCKYKNAKKGKRKINKPNLERLEGMDGC